MPMVYAFMAGALALHAAPLERVALHYEFDKLLDGQAQPAGAPAPWIAGRLTGPAALVPAGRRPGNALVLNGVDNFVVFPAGFSGPQDAVHISICPASDPGDPPADRFARRFGGQSVLDFGGLRATWDAEHRTADWGLAARAGFASRISAKQYVFAADHPTSGFRMQAWLDPGSGKLAVMYAGSDRESGKLRYVRLASQTPVWRRDVWTDVELRIDQRAGTISLVINGQEEATAAFPIMAESRIPHWFTLGGSRRDGLPFYGLLDDFRVTADLPPQNWIFPEGTMAYPPRGNDPFAAGGAGAGFALGMRPLNLDPARDAVRVGPLPGAAGRFAQQIVCAESGGGLIAGPINLPGYQSVYSLRLAVQSAQPGRGWLLAGHSPDPAKSFFRTPLEFEVNCNRLECRDIIKGGDPVYVFVKCDGPGTFWIADIGVE